MLEFIPECYKSHKKCDNAANAFIFLFGSVSNWYKTQEICDCSDRYKTRRMCDEVVDYYLAVLKFISGWLATSKIVKW